MFINVSTLAETDVMRQIVNVARASWISLFFFTGGGLMKGSEFASLISRDPKRF